MLLKVGRSEAELGCGFGTLGSMVCTEHMSGTDYLKLMFSFSFISLAKPGGSTITNNIYNMLMHLYIM